MLQVHFIDRRALVCIAKCFAIEQRNCEYIHGKPGLRIAYNWRSKIETVKTLERQVQA